MSVTASWTQTSGRWETLAVVLTPGSPPPPPPNPLPAGSETGGRGARALKEQFPFRCLLGTEDVTFLLDNGFTFSAVDPGGFEMCSLVIPKDMPQTLRGMPIRIDSGLGVAWEGRVSEVQRSLGNNTTITGEGYGALLKDQDAAMVFVDRDLTYWQGPSVTRQIYLVSGAGWSPGSGQVAADPTSGNPALALLFTGPWTTGGLPDVEMLYDSQGIPLASIDYTITFGASGLASAGIDFALTDQDIFPPPDSAGYLWSSSPVVAGLSVTGSDRVFCIIRSFYTSPAGSDNVQYGAYFSNLAVFGLHGITAVGSPPGFYPSQIATWAMQQATGLQPGVIPATDATGYITPHSVYYTPTGLDQIVSDMATAAGWHWGVWPSQSHLTGNPQPRLDFRPRPAQGQYTASCLRSDCDTCDIREDLSGMYDTAIISFTNVDGTSRAVTVSLANPVLEAVNLHRTVELNGGTMTAATAEVFGLMALDLLYTQSRVAGSITISAAINSMAGPWPAWMLRPGIDRLRVVDLPSADAWGGYNDLPLSRVECSGSTSGFSTSIEIGQGANLVETLQARLSAASTLAAQGGV